MNNILRQPMQLLANLSAVFIFIIILTYASPEAHGEASRIVKVGAYDNPPKITITSGGKVTGFWPELIAHIAIEENWQIEYVKGGWEEGLVNLSSKTIDIMPDVAFTKQRAKLYHFANTPVMASWSRVYVREDDNRIKSLEDLRGMRIAGLSGSVNIEGPDGLKKIVQSFNLNCRVAEMYSYDEVFESLLSGYADAVITNMNFGDEFIKHNPAKKTPIMLSPVTLTFAFPKNAPDTEYLQKRIDFQMAKLMDDSNSIYYELLTKYFSPKIAEKTVHIMPMWAKVLIGFAVIALIFTFAVLKTTQKQVYAKTKELQTLNDNLKEKIDEETANRIRQEKMLYDQQKHADMGQMIKSIAHQWRQPLNNIYIISQNMQDEWENGKQYDADVAQSFERQGELISHMSDTIDDFLHFFKPDKLKSRFNITNSLMRCLRLVNAESQTKRININFMCECEDNKCDISTYQQDNCTCRDIYVDGYEGEFKQIMLNLLSNSIYALSKHESDYKKIDVTISCKDSIITLKVTDNGGGIPDNIMDKIFDPYFTTKKEGEGVGIGLHMSRTIIVNHMNGEINVANKGDGVETTITLSSSSR
jgi:signal transduction histidine kinase